MTFYALHLSYGIFVEEVSLNVQRAAFVVARFIGLFDGSISDKAGFSINRTTTKTSGRARVPDLRGSENFYSVGRTPHPARRFNTGEEGRILFYAELYGFKGKLGRQPSIFRTPPSLYFAFLSVCFAPR